MRCPVCKKPADGPCVSCFNEIVSKGGMPPEELKRPFWVLCKRTFEEFLFITVHNRLVLLDSKKDAEDFLKLVGKGNVDTRGIAVEEVRGDVCWAYAVLRDIELGRGVRDPR